MRLVVVRESELTEKRVPIVPESVKRLDAKKIDLAIEAGAGQRTPIEDGEYQTAGAAIGSRAELFARADTLVRVRVPSLEEIAMMREGSALVSPLYPLVNKEHVELLAARGITAISVDSIPRTTVAQMMDVLSSQATVAGYYAVVMAAAALPRFFPMLITAAGTIAPAKVLVLGAGVAGLSAVGVARRLGAVVEAFDVRKVVKEQVESLGAKFVDVPTDEDAQTAGGYAREVSEETKMRQAEILAKHVAKSDVVITTALVPGRPAPRLVSEEMIRAMRPGSVVVDLAAEQGGNCAVTERGVTRVVHGVSIIGALDLPSHVAMHASHMYSRNMEKLLFHMTKAGDWCFDPGDEIAKGCVVTHAGKIVHERVRQAVEAA